MVVDRGGPDYETDPCPFRQGQPHLAVVTFVGLRCSVCQRPLKMGKVGPQPDPVQDLREKLIADGRFDLAAVRDLSADPPREGLWITGQGAEGDPLGMGRANIVDQRGRVFGHHYLRLKGLMLYWMQRPADEH